MDLYNYILSSSTKAVCIYDGPSQLNNERILSFLYLAPSTNDKVPRFHYTTYIAAHSENNHSEAVCGNCPLQKGLCYVKGYMPLGYYKWRSEYFKGNIPLITNLPAKRKEINKLRKRQQIAGFRFGMDGDPASIPFELTTQLLDIYGYDSLGYTHQSQHPNFDPRYSIFLHSIDSLQQKTSHRYARISADFATETLKPNEVFCPYDLEKSKGELYPSSNCGNCKMCSISSQANIVFSRKKDTSRKLLDFLSASSTSEAITYGNSIHQH